MSWVLIILVVTSATNRESNVLTHVTGFKTLASCSEAAAQTKKAFNSWHVDTRTVCVAQPGGAP